MSVRKTKRANEDSQIPLEKISPLVFISHDHRDAKLAEAFGELIADASTGIVKSFRSSDNKGTSGIEYGAEWYGTVMKKLGAATDVVALLTPHSSARPWILYETGVAKGKLDTTVLGLTLGISLEDAAKGPFAQFQNCDGLEDSITKLIKQLVGRHPDAVPRDEIVRQHVKIFLEKVELATSAKEQSTSSASEDGTSVAKIFEEIKILVRDLPSLPSYLSKIYDEIHELTKHNEMTRSHRGILLPPDRYIKIMMQIGGIGTRVVFTLFMSNILKSRGWPSPDSEAIKILDKIQEAIIGTRDCGSHGGLGEAFGIEFYWVNTQRGYYRIGPKEGMDTIDEENES